MVVIEEACGGIVPERIESSSRDSDISRNIACVSWGTIMEGEFAFLEIGREFVFQ